MLLSVFSHQTWGNRTIGILLDVHFLAVAAASLASFASLVAAAASAAAFSAANLFSMAAFSAAAFYYLAKSACNFTAAISD